MADLVRVEPSVHALLIGSGGPALKDQIAARGLSPNFTLTGEVPEARALLPAGEVFFLSSQAEGMPNILLEAIDAGCAPVATDVGGVRDILGEPATPGEPGPGDFLVKPGAVADAAAKILTLLRDDARREKIGKKAQAGLDKFAPNNIMEEFYRLMDGI
jgi:glycosyltransferase involved in cell wall biosynthesis